MSGIRSLGVVAATASLLLLDGCAARTPAQKAAEPVAKQQTAEISAEKAAAEQGPEETVTAAENDDAASAEESQAPATAAEAEEEGPDKERPADEKAEEAAAADAERAELAARYAPSSPVKSRRVDDGGWDGVHRFNTVYCMTFPDPDQALVLMERSYAEDSINLARVSYRGRMMINVVAAMLPPGQSAADDIAGQRRYLQESESLSGRPHHLKEEERIFGRVLNSRINNLAPAAEGVPYPLVHSFAADDRLRSVSVSRLFARGSNRFEIAIYKLAPEDAGPAEEAAIVTALQKLADRTLSDFEQCTATLPVAAPGGASEADGSAQ